jgi:hypothetical protein
MEEGYENIIINYSKFLSAQNFILLNRTPPRTTNDTKGLWIYGPTGCGKDYSIRGALDRLGTKPYLKLENKWFDGYVT